MVSMMEDGDPGGKQEEHDDAMPDPLMEVGPSSIFCDEFLLKGSIEAKRCIEHRYVS